MRSPALAITLSLILLIVVWQLINFWQLTRWQQALLTQVNTVELKDKNQNKKTPKSITDKTPEAAQKTPPKIHKKNVKPLSLAQVELPAVPHSSKNDMPVQIQQKETVKLPKQKTKAVQTKPIEKIKQRKNNNNNNNKAQSVSSMYQQLTSNNAIDIEIAWPKNNIERQNTFTFLYQCLGMKFGVLNGQQTNQPKVTLAKQPYTNVIKSNTDNQISDWLRIAQGQLAHQEQEWLQKYELSGTPVRLFPKAIDWQLATLLTQQLGNAPLTSFRARYKYSNNRLMLTNIKLNQVLLTNNWVLITSQCLI